ncbi:MAG: GNAT family N-acetyltransferase [Actinomycetia bacterium]|nr:GNAT family N-acetyltransferase [Actinomycetes bacterium]
MTVADSDVRPMTPDDGPGMIGVLATGFMDDAFMRWAAPDEVARTVLTHQWATAATGMVVAGHVEGYVADDMAGGALWAAPGVDFWTDEGRAAFFGSLVGAMGERAPELARLAPFGEAHPAEPHWYLHKIAVHPARQGAGVGQRLLDPILVRADEGGYVIHLESSNPRNRSFYHRNGFEPGLSVDLDEDDDLLVMTRQPR